MAGFNFAPINVQQQPQTSLADMMNIARGAQAYQQAQQLNPLALQQAQMTIEQLQQTNPLAVEKAKADLSTAQTQAQKSKQDLMVSGEDYARRMINALPKIDSFKDKNGEINKNALAESLGIVREATIAVGLPKHPSNLLGQMEKAIEDGDFAKYEKLRLTSAGSSASPSEQFGAKFPTANLANLGGIVQPVATGNPQMAETAPGTKIGAPLPTSIAPQVVTDPITKQQYVVGGQRDVSGNLTGNITKSGPPTATTATPQATTATATTPRATTGTAPPMVMSPTRFNPQLTPMPNESPENFNARIASNQATLEKAKDQFSNAKSEYGHLPTIRTVNDHIMELLHDEDVRPGVVSNYLANKTNKGILNDKETQLTKYLEQRIQNLSTKSDADAESKRAAYGSFSLGKEPLKEIVRQDNAWLTQQELQARGIQNNAGYQVNPRLGAVQGFNNEFAKFASSKDFPDLMRYISIVGENPNKLLIKEYEKDHAKNFMGNMPLQRRQALEQQRQQLLKLVGGQ
jgi:hypothetical protein